MNDCRIVIGNGSRDCFDVVSETKLMSHISDKGRSDKSTKIYSLKEIDYKIVINVQ